MSDGWFDRSYRSGETPPAELDARVLAAARRATRRWTLPVIAAGAFTIVAAAVLGLLITGHALYVPPGEVSHPDATGNQPEFQVDVVRPPIESDATLPTAPYDRREPGATSLPNLRTEFEDDMEPAAKSPELDCKRTALIGPLGGAGRRDLVQVCAGDSVSYIEIVWDGDPSCPSRLELNTPAGAAVSLDKGDLVAGPFRVRCEGGQWTRTDTSPPGSPVAPLPD